METGEALLHLTELAKWIADNNEALRKENEELRNKLKPHPNCDRSCMYLCESGAELLKRENDELKAKLDSNTELMNSATDAINILKAKLEKAKDCIRDILKDDDAQAFKEARKTLEEI